MTKTKMTVYSNGSTGESAQIYVDTLSIRTTVAKFNSRGRRISIRQIKFVTEDLAREFANNQHRKLVGSGFRITQKR